MFVHIHTYFLTMPNVSDRHWNAIMHHSLKPSNTTTYIHTYRMYRNTKETQCSTFSVNKNKKTTTTTTTI